MIQAASNPKPPAALVKDVSTAISTGALVKKRHVLVKGFGPQGEIDSEVWLELPGRIWVASEYPNCSVNRPDKWKLFLDKSMLLGIDDMRGWYFRRDTKDDKSRKNAYGEFMGDIPSSAALTAGPQQALDTLGQAIRQFSGWKRTETTKQIRWAASLGQAKAVIVIDKKSGELAEFSEDFPKIKGSGSQNVHWIYSSRAWTAPPSMSIPSYYVKTSLFSLAEPYPVYRDKTATALAKKCIDLYERLESADILADGDDGPFEIIRKPDQFTVKAKDSEWTYSKGHVQYTIGTKKGSESVDLADVPRFLNTMKLPYDRLVTTLLGRYNFGVRSFLKGYSAHLVGQIAEGIALEDVVTLRGPVVEITLKIDDKSGFITSIESTAYTPDGRKLSQSIRTYQLVSR